MLIWTMAMALAASKLSMPSASDVPDLLALYTLTFHPLKWDTRASVMLRVLWVK